MEKLEFVGVWYLPQSPDNRIYGTLKFDPKGGSTLELMGNFVSLFDSGLDHAESNRFEIIHGIASGKLLTLRNCVDIGGTVSFPGIEISKYRISVIYSGHHFESIDHVKFKEIQLQFSNFDDWVGINLFSSSYSQETGQITLGCVIPETIPLLKNDELEFVIRFVVSTNGLGFASTKVGMQCGAILGVTAKFEKTFDEFLAIASGFQNLISLAVKTSVRIISIKGLVTCDQNENDWDEIDRIVEIIYNVSDFIPDPMIIAPHQMLFSFFDLYNNNPNFLQNWLNRYDQLRDVLQLFFGIYHNPKMYMQQKFLSAVQSLESYHRRTMQNHEVLTEEHKERMDSILNAVPDEHKEWLSERLRYSYEPNLRKRLKEIWAMNQEILSKFFNSQNKAKLIEMAIVNRNYLTHYDVSLQDRKASVIEMYDLTNMLMLIMIICLLRELGFDSNKIHDLICRNQEYIHSIKRFKQY